MATDKRTVQIIVVFLGLVVLLGLGLTGWLIDQEKDASLVVALSSAALGSLGTLLASTRTVDSDQLQSSARNEALADVASLADQPAAPAVTQNVYTAEAAHYLEEPDLEGLSEEPHYLA